MRLGDAIRGLAVICADYTLALAVISEQGNSLTLAHWFDKQAVGR
jgi:hypothetical protein